MPKFIVSSGDYEKEVYAPCAKSAAMKALFMAKAGNTLGQYVQIIVDDDGEKVKSIQLETRSLLDELGYD
jgi:hypothetical protein